nr:helix-turn-helix domain-containing protein [Clostridia bacterium]
MKIYNQIPVEGGISVSSLVTVYYLRLPKNYNGMREKLPFYQLVYIDSGEMEYTVGDNTFTLRAGQTVLMPPDAVRSGRLVSSGRGFIGIVSFTSSSEALESISAQPGEGKTVPVLEPSPNEVSMLREILNEGVSLLEPIYGDAMYKGMRLRDESDGVSVSVVAAKLTLLLTLLKRGAGISRHRPDASASDAESEIRLMGRVKEYLSRRVCSEVTVADICREFNISSSRLKRIFHENEGCGVIDFFIELKIERAKAMICEDKMNFTQISERLGFSSLHYFSRLFRSRTGTTPSEYRRLNSRLNSRPSEKSEGNPDDFEIL